MAIYRCSVKDNLTRSKGQSAVASAAYIAREKLHDERLGQTFNFARHDDKALWSGIYAPKDAPEWARDRQALWNEVEKAEKRKDAQIARPIEIALPHELTLEQNRYALQDFIRENFTRKGYVVDASIHSPSRDGDERNIHAHLLISLRTIDENGFSKSKQQEQENYRNKSAYTEALRESWERIGNRHLERHGHAPTLDRRTLAAQGIDREATKHRGPHVDAMERKGKQTERGEECRAIEERNRELAEARRDLAEVSKELAQVQRKPEQTREAEPKQEQALGRTAGEIRLAYSLTDSGKGFAEALEDRGLILAEVTAADLAPWENRRELESLLHQQKKGVWTVAKGGLDALNEQQRAKAGAAYQKWKHKDKADLKSYVDTVQKHKADRITALKNIVANEPTPEGPPLPWYIEQGDLVVLNERGHLTRLTERTTGDDRDELDKYLATVDRAPLLNVADAHAVALEARAATLQHRQAARTADVLERQAAERERLEEQHAEARAKIEQNPALADSAKGWKLKHLELSQEIESDSLEARQYRHRQWARVADPERDERGAILAANFEAAQDQKLLLDGFNLAPEPAQTPDDSAAAFLKNRQDARADRHAEYLESRRDRAPDMNRPALGGTVAQGFGMAASVATKAADRFADLAGQLLDMLSPAPPPLTFRDYLNSKEARERHFQEQREQGERDATLWKIIADRREGKDLNPDSMRDELRKLNRNDLEKIKTYGEDGLKQIVADHEREIQRQRERDRGRER